MTIPLLYNEKLFHLDPIRIYKGKKDVAGNKIPISSLPYYPLYFNLYRKTTTYILRSSLCALHIYTETVTAVRAVIIIIRTYKRPYVRMCRFKERNNYRHQLSHFLCASTYRNFFPAKIKSVILRGTLKITTENHCRNITPL